MEQLEAAAAAADVGLRAHSWALINNCRQNWCTPRLIRHVSRDWLKHTSMLEKATRGSQGACSREVISGLRYPPLAFHKALHSITCGVAPCAEWWCKHLSSCTGQVFHVAYILWCHTLSALLCHIMPHDALMACREWGAKAPYRARGILGGYGGGAGSREPTAETEAGGGATCSYPAGREPSTGADCAADAAAAAAATTALTPINIACRAAPATTAAAAATAAGDLACIAVPCAADATPLSAASRIPNGAGHGAPGATALSHRIVCFAAKISAPKHGELSAVLAIQIKSQLASPAALPPHISTPPASSPRAKDNPHDSSAALGPTAATSSTDAASSQSERAPKLPPSDSTSGAHGHDQRPSTNAAPSLGQEAPMLPPSDTTSGTSSHNQRSQGAPSTTVVDASSGSDLSPHTHSSASAPQPSTSSSRSSRGEEAMDRDGEGKGEQGSSPQSSSSNAARHLSSSSSSSSNNNRSSNGRSNSIQVLKQPAAQTHKFEVRQHVVPNVSYPPPGLGHS
eukprot:1156772-Pelagomonas_calceolata.AAC.24